MNLKEGSYCVFQKVFIPSKYFKNRYSHNEGIPGLSTEDCPDIFSDRFLWLWVRLQKKFRNLCMLLK